MGGTHPGHTTDAVAAMAAERVRATRLVIGTNVDSVYDDDPKKNPAARPLRIVHGDKLIEISFKMPPEAGSAGVVDPLAARLISRSRIKTSVVNGRNLVALENAILGKEFEGTIVEPSKK